MTIVLSESQQLAFNKYKLGENVFITGPGGSGKSELIRTIVEDAKDFGKNVQVCALTGTAAVLLQCNAKTIHSWGGIGLGNGDNLAVANKVNKSKFKKKNWKMVDLLIVDEVSMMSLKLFELLEMTARLCRRNVKVFGGIQVLFTGDFYQLPPVGTEAEPDTCKFCFESPLWGRVFTNQIQLKEIFRQTDDVYKKILNQIRVGKMTKSSVAKLNDFVGRKVPDGETMIPPILFPIRRRVDQVNSRSLGSLTGSEKTYEFMHCDVNDLQLTETKVSLAAIYSEEDKKREYEYMVINVNFDKKLTLKEGAQVMCVANIDMQNEKTPVCNGSQGIVEKIDETDGLPIVRFKNGRSMKIGYHIWQSEKIPTVGVKQIPLILAWAITIHKSQGASLDMAEIDIGKGIFECGQTYVALSRLRSMDGLYLKSFDLSKITINKKVRDFYDALE